MLCKGSRGVAPWVGHAPCPQCGEDTVVTATSDGAVFVDHPLPGPLSTERLGVLRQWVTDQGHLIRVTRQRVPTDYNDLGRALDELLTLREEYAELRWEMDGLQN